MQTLVFTVETAENLIRLDNFLSEKIPTFTRSKIKTLIESQNVSVQGEIAGKSGIKLKAGWEITITIPNPETPIAKPENIPLEIIYQDSSLAVINKPQGMVVHAGNGNSEKTLVNALLYHIKDLSGINGVLRPGIVHRLDKNTSGLLVVAKNDVAHVHLAKQIEQKTAKRTYQAILEGNIKNDSGHIETRITRSTKNRLIFTTQNAPESAKIAITDYRVLKRFKGGYCLVEFNLQTGRTHQIRVHSKEILNAPIAGDTEYGGHTPKVLFKKDAKSLGQYLVAKKLEFVHPQTGKNMSFEIPLPAHFVALLLHLEEQ